MAGLLVAEPVLWIPTVERSGQLPKAVDHGKSPMHNGESMIANILTRQNMPFAYEAWQFSLDGSSRRLGFRPDFVIYPWREWPTIILEVTQADLGRSREARQRMRRKKKQAEETFRLHGFTTVILKSTHLNEVKRRWSRLNRIIELKLAEDASRS